MSNQGQMWFLESNLTFLRTPNPMYQHYRPWQERPYVTNTTESPAVNSFIRTVNITSPYRCWMAPCWWWLHRWQVLYCSSTEPMHSSWTPHGPHPPTEMGCYNTHTHTHTEKHERWIGWLLQAPPLSARQVMSGLTSSLQVQGQVGAGLPAPWAQEEASNLLQQQQQQTFKKNQ